MEWLKDFSTDYANAVTAIVALAGLILAAVTLAYLRREYKAKYRPYVVPGVKAVQMPDQVGCALSIHPINVGPHPCKVKLSKIVLQIGDEAHTTPTSDEWSLIGPQGVEIAFPCGHVNALGVSNIREGRYRSNRIEVSFILHTKSVDDGNLEQHSFAYEIDVRGDKPQPLSRPDWVIKL